MVSYPKDWEEKKLGNIIDLYDNLRVPVSKDKRTHGRTPYYGANGIQDHVLGYTHYGEFVLLAEDGANSLAEYPIKYITGKAWINNHVHVVSGKSNIADTTFLSYALKKVNYENILVGGTRAKLNGKTLKNIEIVIPPFPEQQAIADALTAFDTHINNLAKLIEKKKMIRDGAVEDLVSGKRRLAGFSGKWESKSLLDIAIILNGLTYKPEDVRPYGKLVIRSSNIKDGKLVYIDNVYVDEAKSTSEDVAIGDVIICVRNGSSALIGKSAYVQENIDATVGAFMSNIRCHNTHLSKFFYYFTKTETFKDFINEVLGATINQITKSDLKRLKFAIPLSLYEQQAIADILTAMDKEISDLEEEKEKYIALKAGAMDDLLTGKIRLV